MGSSASAPQLVGHEVRSPLVHEVWDASDPRPEEVTLKRDLALNVQKMACQHAGWKVGQKDYFKCMLKIAIVVSSDEPRGFLEEQCN